MPEVEFVFSAGKLGSDRYIGKTVGFRKARAEDWDELRQTGGTLSSKLGPDAAVMILENEDLESVAGQVRAYFFTPDNRAISKWGRLIKSLDNTGLKLSGPDDLIGKYIEWEERTVQMGSRGEQRVLEAVGIPTPEEVSALEERRVAAIGAPQKAKAEAVEEVSADVFDGLKSLILDIGEGKTRTELENALVEQGAQEEDMAVLDKAIAELLTEKKLRFDIRTRKYKVL